MTPTQQQLVSEGMPLATRMAGARSRQMRADWRVSPDDVRQMALLGLCEAALRYRPGAGVPFLPYAARRIGGAVTDGLRSCVHDLRNKDAEPTFVSIVYDEATDDGYDPPALSPSPEDVATARHALAALSGRCRQVVIACDIMGYSHRDLADVWGITPSRVSQIRTAGIAQAVQA